MGGPFLTSDILSESAVPPPERPFTVIEASLQVVSGHQTSRFSRIPYRWLMMEATVCSTRGRRCFPTLTNTISMLSRYREKHTIGLSLTDAGRFILASAQGEDGRTILPRTACRGS